MSGLLDLVGSNELWSQTNFTQESDFPLDIEFIQPQIDGSLIIADWNMEDTTASSRSSETPQVCSSPETPHINKGPRLLPKIREQDRVVENVTPSKYGTNGGRRPSDPPLAQYMHPNEAHRSFCSTTDGLYDSQEQSQRTTTTLPSLEFALPDSWTYTPEDHDTFDMSISESFPLLDQANDSYLIHDGHIVPRFTPSRDYHASPLTSESHKTLPPGQVIHPNMYPSSYPRAMQALARTPCRSLCSVPSSMSTCLSLRAKTAPVTKMTIVKYLSLPNPACEVIAWVDEPDVKREMHFFWDVRNIRDWSAFNLETMLDVPELRSLLHSGVPCADLPRPRPVSTSRYSKPGHLRLAHMSHYGIKLNAALKMASTQPDLQMRINPYGSLTTPPDFVSSVSTIQEQNMSRDSRIVGIVLCYNQWNSSMRTGNEWEQKRYLRGLARLQDALRKHQCRYGFIITEIELVCVRYGGDDIIAQQAQPAYSFSHITSGHFIPIFGYFEVSAAIPLSHNHIFPNGPNRKCEMTAGLALWFLHMHARDVPLPGQHHRRIDVGTGITMTRQKHLPQDPGMQKPSPSHERVARYYRGWVLPSDKYNPKLEGGSNKRTVTGKRKS